MAGFAPATLDRLGRALGAVGEVEEAVALMRLARRLHPGDFWINTNLADFLSRLRPPRF